MHVIFLGAGFVSVFVPGREVSGESVMSNGEAAMARCAESLVSKIARMVLSLCGFWFWMLYCASLVFFLSGWASEEVSLLCHF